MRTHRGRVGLLVLLCISGLLAALPGAATATGPTFTAGGSVEQVYVTGTPSGALVTLENRHGKAVAFKYADSLGGTVFRNVAPRKGYRVFSGGKTSGPLTVMPNQSAPPSTKIYKQTIPSTGYGYLTTRDGTKLAIDVRLPSSGHAPYPTLIEYAGYGYADPYNGPDSGIATIANLMGFAVVDVNMRGTGCSGGAFDYFEPLQSLDGYDVVETVARQAWVLHHKVGTLGISYGGISQLFVASTRPPHLAAITPLSVIDSSATTLYPGGILNTGFALAWAKDRVNDALPASPTGGQPWALHRIQDGDQVCAANQVLHAEAVNLIAKVYANNYYVPAVADPVDPVTFVHKISVPTYMACQFTDEQTGGHCPTLAQHMTGTRWKWFTFTNGVHVDSLDPKTFNRFFDFLELFVAHQVPHLSPAVKALAPTIYATVMGISGVTLPPDPIQNQPTYAAALAAFKHLPSVRVLFDNGAGASSPGLPYPGFEHSFPRFPVPGTHAKSWYLSPGGVLSAGKPAKLHTNRFRWNPTATAATDYPPNLSTGGGGLWSAIPQYAWAQNPSGTALSYLSAPLKKNTVVVGAGGVQLWIKASVPNVDLQVTLTEVRADGKEEFVQGGWLRASERKLDAATSTLLAPAPSFRKADAAPLPQGRWTQLTIPLYYEGHAYRRGARIRIIISAPGGDQPIWGFSQLIPHAKPTVRVAYSRHMPSRLILPVVSGVAIPTAPPACPGLRGEPCRQYQRLINR